MIDSTSFETTAYCTDEVILYKYYYYYYFIIIIIITIIIIIIIIISIIIIIIIITQSAINYFIRLDTFERHPDIFSLLPSK